MDMPEKNPSCISTFYLAMLHRGGGKLLDIRDAICSQGTTGLRSAGATLYIPLAKVW